jgi:hypothetical protein
MKSSKREELLTAAMRSLTVALELHDGTPIATQSALWEVQAAKRRLVEVEASLFRRLTVISPPEPVR